jgi:hypothetical protein
MSPLPHRECLPYLANRPPRPHRFDGHVTIKAFWLRAMALRRQVRRTGTETSNMGGRQSTAGGAFLHVIASSDCCASDWWGRSPPSNVEEECATVNARLARQGRKTGASHQDSGPAATLALTGEESQKGRRFVRWCHPPSSCFPRCIRFVSILMRGRVEEREERASGCFLFFEQRCRVPRACR